MKALITTDEALTTEQKRLQSSVRLVADQCIPATFYYNGDWAKISILGQCGLDASKLNKKTLDNISNLFEANGLSKDIPTSFSDKMPRVVYVSHEDWKKRSEGDNSLPVKTPQNEFVFAQSEFLHKSLMEDRGISANNAILCLAAVGLNIMLPNISLDLIAEEEIEKIRDALKEERIGYLNSITQIADETYDRFQEKDFNEIIRWAQDEVTFKLAPKARCIEESVLKLNTKTIVRAGVKVWKDSTLAIGASYFKGGALEAAKTSAVELLKVMLSVLEQDFAKRKLPEIAYAAKIYDRVVK